MSKSHVITRRSVVITLAAASAAALSAAPACGVPLIVDAETDGLSGLPLAAVHIERAIDAMATVQHGTWTVKIHSGEAGQPWAFERRTGTAVSKDERLHQLMSDWRTEFDAVTTAAAETLSDIALNRLNAMEREASTIRPATLEGFAIKLLLLTNYGEFDLDDFRAGLIAEAEAIAGYVPPATLKREA
jgi:hypothetical protein